MVRELGIPELMIIGVAGVLAGAIVVGLGAWLYRARPPKLKS